MTIFEKDFFKKFEFERKQIERYFENALRDLKIAREDSFVEVRFTYCYQALIKAGIALIAQKGNVRIRAVPGHHLQILRKMSELLVDPDILTIGDAMRMKRNRDLYSGGEFISKKEVEDYLKFVEVAILKVKNIILR